MANTPIGSRRARHGRRLRVRLWLPWLIVLGAIVAFSSQPYSKQDLRPQLKRWVPEQVVNLIPADLEVQYGKSTVSVAHVGPYGFMEFVIRKGAHFGLFGLFAILLYRLLWRRMGMGWAAVAALAGSALFAMLDEFHQYYTPMRSSRVADVVLDCAGAATGILLYWLVLRLRGARR